MSSSWFHHPYYEVLARGIGLLDSHDAMASRGRVLCAYYLVLDQFLCRGYGFVSLVSWIGSGACASPRFVSLAQLGSRFRHRTWWHQRFRALHRDGGRAHLGLCICAISPVVGCVLPGRHRDEEGSTDYIWQHRGLFCRRRQRSEQPGRQTAWRRKIWLGCFLLVEWQTGLRCGRC